MKQCNILCFVLLIGITLCGCQAQPAETSKTPVLYNHIEPYNPEYYIRDTDQRGYKVLLLKNQSVYRNFLVSFP